MSEGVPEFVAELFERLEVTVAGQKPALLSRYLDLLLETNRRMNLTGIRDRDAAWRRHVVDSLTLEPGLRDLASGARVIDVGSGGGLPGIPVAIVLDGLEVTLLESTGKKARFLEGCVAELGLPNVSVANLRAEQAGQDRTHRERYDVAVCRAVGPLRELLEYTVPLVRVGGKLMAMKGPSVEGELAEAGDALATLGVGDVQVFDAYPAGFDEQTVIVSAIKDRPTPKRYPRLPGTPRREPL